MNTYDITRQFPQTLLQLMQRQMNNISLAPINLGGVSSGSGGTGTPPGGFSGQLAQRYVTYDTTELAVSGSLSGYSGSYASLVDNLNRIRFWGLPSRWFEPSISGGTVTVKSGIWWTSGSTYIDYAGGTIAASDGCLYLDTNENLHIDASFPASGSTYNPICTISSGAVSKDVRKFFNEGGSTDEKYAGVKELPSYQDNGDGTVTVGSGIYRLYSSSLGDSTCEEYSLPGGTFTLTSGSINYIYASYNNGSPAVLWTTTRTDISSSYITSTTPIFTIYREGTTLFYLDWDTSALGAVEKLTLRTINIHRFERESGLSLSASGSNFSITSGVVWYGLNDESLAAVSSLTDDTNLVYYNGASWVEIPVKSYDNLHYQGASGLSTLTNNRYAVNWVYRSIAHGTKRACIVLGTGDYKLSEAQSSSAPGSLPSGIVSLGMLVGRIIVMKSDTSATEVDSAFTTELGIGPITLHNELTGLQGGTTDQYYHLALSEYPPLNKIERYGFMGTVQTGIAFNDSTRLFTLSDLGSGWSYYRAGTLYTISGNQTVTIADTTGIHYIYIDATDGTLTESTSAWTLNDTKVPVAIIVWNSTLTPKYQIADERHTCLIDRRTHRYEHSTEGTKFVSGGTLSGYTINTDTNDAKAFSISATNIADEDLFWTLDALGDPGGTLANYSVWYRTTTTTYAWAYSIMPFKYGTYIQYDSSGSMVEGQNNKFYNSYLMFTNVSGSSRYIILPGRGEFSTAAEAYAENPANFDFTGLNIAESVIAYQLTWSSSSSHTSLGKCVLYRAPQRINIATATATIPASADHNALSGLQGGAANEYYHLTNAQYQSLVSGSSGGGWGLIGNAGTTAGTNYLGTTDAQAFVIKTGGKEVANIPYWASNIDGNARGATAIDISLRTNAANVASGNPSVNIGVDCKASGNYSVAIGRGAVASGTYSINISPDVSEASGASSTVVGGAGGVASATSSTAIGGEVPRATGTRSLAIGGYYPEASGAYAASVGGYDCSAAGDCSFVCGNRGNIDAAHDGTFLFSDLSVSSAFNSVAANEAAFRVTGGLRVAYDNSNWVTLKVGSTGAGTFDSIGSGSAFQFSKPTTIDCTATPQFKVRYDANNRLDLSVSSAGAITLDAVGASAGFTFSDAITLSEGAIVATGKTIGLGSGKGLIQFDDAATDTITISNCNVGIGITPGVKFDVVSGAFGMRVRRLSTDVPMYFYSDSAGAGICPAANTHNVIYIVPDDSIRMYGNDAEQFRVLNGGGISTNAGTNYWTLLGYTATAPSATGYVSITINGTTYKLLAST